MKTIRELNIKDWSGYFFEEMVNILDIDPECFMVSDAKNVQVEKCYTIFVILTKLVYHTLFLII